LRIWHDNSGGSWFLKLVIVHDLQTRERFIFVCNNWLSVETSIDRLLPVCTKVNTKQFKYLLERQTKNKLSDGHLWFSIFLRPPNSSFTRIDRLTCCFLLLFMSMLLNILYYGMETDSSSTSSSALTIGPLSIKTEQVKKLNLMKNLMS
jgi:polycystin 1L2